MLPSGTVIGIVTSCAYMEARKVMYHHINYCLPVSVVTGFLSRPIDQQLRLETRLREDPEFATVWKLAVPKHLGALHARCRL